ncbi:hypothetical protein OAT72_01885 [Alphaproteobacteria bacterium]|nr:hypothetical protein [Alphaproteobacteria bacterium]
MTGFMRSGVTIVNLCRKNRLLALDKPGRSGGRGITAGKRQQ